MEIERKRAFLIQTLYWLLLAALFVVLVKYGLPLLSPFVLGFLVAAILRKPTRQLVRRLNLPHKPVAFFVVLLFYATVGLLIAWLTVRAVSAVGAFIELLPHLYDIHLLPAFSELFFRLEDWVLALDPALFSLILSFEEQFLSWLGSTISSLSGWAVSASAALATAIPGLFIKLVLLIISTFFIAMDFNVLRDFCLRQMGETSAALFLQIKQYVVGTLFVCIGSYLLIMSLTCVELAIGFTLIGLEHAVLIAALIAVFDVLPVLGTGGIMIPWGVICLIRGDVSLGVKLLLIYVVVTVIRNIVEPKIVGHQLGLHPVVTLSSMFAGVQLFGVVGLFGFPIGLSLLRYLNDNGSIRLFRAAEAGSDHQ